MSIEIFLGGEFGARKGEIRTGECFDPLDPGPAREVERLMWAFPA